MERIVLDIAEPQLPLIILPKSKHIVILVHNHGVGPSTRTQQHFERWGLIVLRRGEGFLLPSGRQDWFESDHDRWRNNICHGRINRTLSTRVAPPHPQPPLAVDRRAVELTSHYLFHFYRDKFVRAVNLLLTSLREESLRR